ncbi:hypothetical protein CAP35_06025 [Chitinophagaceae bacterium IBVUCB1]|nr:hypothetical protein CAP35_06025 [Chitinophagaceae bacterium IBVUCB1]
MQDMTRTLRYLFLLLFVGFAGTAMAQVGGIVGKVLDDKKEPIMGAVVEVSQAGVKKAGDATDEDGNYNIRALNPGRYDVVIRSATFKVSKTEGVLVSPDRNTTLNIEMEVNNQELEVVVVKVYKAPLITEGGTKIMRSEDLEKMPTRNTSSMVSTQAGVYQSREGAGLSIGGARGDGTAYIVDGIRVYGSRGTNLAQGAIDQVEVLSSGLSAKYGDAIGGVVNITTKGVSKNITGGLLLERSVEGYGHNLVNFNLSGPLYSKRLDTLGNKKPIVGFRLDGDFIYDKDRNPSWTRHYQPNEGVRDRIVDRPFVTVPNQNGIPVFNYASEYLRLSDFNTVKARPNASVMEGRLNGRIDYQLADNLNLQAGGTFSYSRANSYSRALSLFALDAIPTVHNYTTRGYIRLTQKFGVAKTEPGQKKPVISNAFYSLQADYQKDASQQDHPKFGEDLFKYAYVGKFYTDYVSIYAPGIDDSTGINGVRLALDRFSNGVRYERSELNPELANYTTQFFNERGTRPSSLTDVFAQNFLTNGYFPATIYGRYFNPGVGVGSYGRGSVDQVGINVDASFDFQPRKTRHQIEFGLYYQQQVHRSYSAGAFAGGTNIWQYARQLSNSHISLDYANPIFIVGGNRYTRAQVEAGLVTPSPYDTIIYNRTSDSISVFAKNLRNKLGLKETDYVDVDNYDPSVFSLDMFSADELLNSGLPFVGYSGYDYKGNRLRGQVNFNDFFTKRDANGNLTREIGAYRPNYIAGYILDKFTYKDMSFNIGIRIDRFDANTKVLRDPYSLYAVHTARDVTNNSVGTGTQARNITNTLNGGVRPGNIGDDYVVYVNNNQSNSANIIGYRNGDDWYDYAGKLIEDPNVLKNYSGGRDPQPLLKNPNDNIQSNSFDPDQSFTDYKPQVNVMPRIAFNFPISDVALFYAHYDVVVQRPQSNVFTSPLQYYYMTSNTQDIINNPDLKPEKLFDYEVGFKQKLTDESAITITGFYKERKDMIQVRPYLFAWPVTYFTYGNRDFSTTKGLTLNYDMRRVGNLRMNIAYTLQFAEGTGSNANTTARGGNFSSGILGNFIAAGIPNMRMTNVLDYDSRHNIVTTIDYRYGKGEGRIGGKPVLENAGVNFIFRARSGEPYTKFRQPLRTNNLIDGGVNGSRLGWHFGLDMRLDKDFMLNNIFGSKGDAQGKRPLMLNAFVLVQNLLNIKDILNVDGFTGRPDDDGYLASPQGVLDIETQVNPQSFVDYYNMTLWNHGNINFPRRINIGLQLNF